MSSSGRCYNNHIVSQSLNIWLITKLRVNATFKSIQLSECLYVSSLNKAADENKAPFQVSVGLVAILQIKEVCVELAQKQYIYMMNAIEHKWNLYKSLKMII